MGRAALIGLLLLMVWLVVAGAGVLVFIGALRRAHLADERMGSHDAVEPRRLSGP